MNAPRVDQPIHAPNGGPSPDQRVKGKRPVSADVVPFGAAAHDPLVEAPELTEDWFGVGSNRPRQTFRYVMGDRPADGAGRMSRGCLYGCLLVLPFWALIALIAWALT